MTNHKNYPGDEILRELVHLKNVIESNLTRFRRSKGGLNASRSQSNRSGGSKDKSLSFMSKLKASFEAKQAEFGEDFAYEINDEQRRKQREEERKSRNVSFPEPSTPVNSFNRINYSSYSPSPFRKSAHPSSQRTPPRLSVSTRPSQLKTRKSHSNSRRVY